jgi:hypothetical protein
MKAASALHTSALREALATYEYRATLASDEARPLGQRLPLMPSLSSASGIRLPIERIARCFRGGPTSSLHLSRSPSRRYLGGGSHAGDGGGLECQGHFCKVFRCVSSSGRGGLEWPLLARI